MHVKRFSILIGLILLMSIAPVLAEVSVSATVNRKQLRMGETLRLSLQIENGDGSENISLPKKSSFRWQQGGTSQQTSIVNGSMTRSVAYSFRLHPMQEGDLVIPPITVVYKNKSFHTEPISIHVSTSKNPGNTTSEKLNTDPGDALFVELQASRETVYVDEPLLLQFKLYEQAGLQVQRRQYQGPNLDGFLQEGEAQQKNFRQNLQGTAYEVTEISYLLYPTRAGKFDLGLAGITAQVVQATGRQSRQRRHPLSTFFDDPFFNPGMYKTVEVDRFSKPMTIDVLPLPEEGRPENFSGTVGEYTMQVEVSHQEKVKVGEAITLTVKVQGTGSIKNIGEPVLQGGEFFKQFDPEVSVQISPQHPLKGEKIFKRILIPEREGEQPIPSVAFSFFNPGSQKFTVLEWDGPRVVVEKTEDTTESQILSAPQTGFMLNPGKTIELQGQDIIFLETDPMILQPESRPLDWRFFLGGVFLNPLLLLCWLGIDSRQRKMQNDPKLKKRLLAYKQWNQNLHQLKRNKTGNTPFMEQSHGALTRFLSMRWDLPVSLTSAEVDHYLEPKGIPAMHREDLKEYLSTLDRVRFASQALEASKEKELLARMHRTVTALEKYKG